MKSAISTNGVVLGIDSLKGFFIKEKRVAIAFSGGVDSTYLLHLAAQYAQSVKAYYVKSQFQPKQELDEIKELEQRLGVEVCVLPFDVLQEEAIASNPKNRCYYCKKKIFSIIIREAKKDGYDVILDGTNASDAEDDRPGMQALKELKILSPLRMCGLTKEEIRLLSKEAKLPTWNKPAYACLATRIPSGRRIELSMLERTEKSEAFLMSLGFRDFRIRTIGEGAKIQVLTKQLPLGLQHREHIVETLKTMYDSVLLDLEARKNE